MSKLKITRYENEGFTTFSNKIFRRNGLKGFSKYLLMMMLSLPEDWNFSVRGLEMLVEEGHDAIITALKQLEDYGYLVREQAHGTKGLFGNNIYHLYEDPSLNPAFNAMDNSKLTNSDNMPRELNETVDEHINILRKPCTDFPSTVDFTGFQPCTDFPSTVKPSTVNPSQENKNIININNNIYSGSSNARVRESADRNKSQDKDGMPEYELRAKKQNEIREQYRILEDEEREDFYKKLEFERETFLFDRKLCLIVIELLYEKYRLYHGLREIFDANLYNELLWELKRRLESDRSANFHDAVRKMIDETIEKKGESLIEKRCDDNPGQSAFISLYGKYFNADELSALFQSCSEKIVPGTIAYKDRDLWISDYMGYYKTAVDATADKTYSTVFQRLLNLVRNDYEGYAGKLTEQYAK